MKAPFLSPFPCTCLSLFINIVLLWASWLFFSSRYTEKFSTNYHNDRWNGNMLRRNEGLPWWHSQRIRLYVYGHVTNIWLNRCYARASSSKGHLTSICGSNRRPIQLNLFAILSAGQADYASAAAAADKPRTFSTPLCPGNLSGAEKQRAPLHIVAVQAVSLSLMNRQGLIGMKNEMAWIKS